MRILVLEEVSFVRHNMKQLLTELGHVVACPDSGEQALQLLRTDHKIDVVITCLSISGMSAIKLFLESQSIQYNHGSDRPTGPAFILTTTTERSSADSNKTVTVQQALDLGFVEVLLKPIDSEKLTALLHGIETNIGSGARENRPQDIEGTHLDSLMNQDNNESQIQMMKEIRSSFTQLQTEISIQIKRLDNALETISN